VPSVRISTSFFTLLNPIWVSDLRTPGKKFFILKSMADICHFVFLVHAECALKKLSTDVLRLLFCTAGQEQPAFIAALHEKDVENCGEEDVLTIWTRCPKNLEKTRE
jgi:hypothetical protein